MYLVKFLEIIYDNKLYFMYSQNFTYNNTVHSQVQLLSYIHLGYQHIWSQVAF